MPKKIKLLILWVVLLSADTGAQLLIKIGAEKISIDDLTKLIIPDLVKLLPGLSLVILGLSLYIAAFIVWMQILKFMRLSIALAITSLLYITVSASSFFILGEQIRLPLIIGTLFIVAGVIILGISEGQKES